MNYFIYYLQESFTWNKQSSRTNFQAPHSVLLLLGFRAMKWEPRHHRLQHLSVNVTNNSPSLTAVEGIGQSKQKFDAMTSCSVDLYEVRWLLHGPNGFVWFSIQNISFSLQSKSPGPVKQ